MHGAAPKESIYRIDRTDDGSLRFHSIVPTPHRAFSVTGTHEPPCLALQADVPVPAPSFPPPKRRAPSWDRESAYPMACWPDHGPGETLNAFGMFWKRELVSWSGSPVLLGRRSEGAPLFNFARQVGFYLLQDGARTVYVGRAGSNLYARLKAHTTDRLAGRWNRFSWFGLRDASQHSPYLHSGCWSETSMLKTIEALLIETLEPPLNRRGGDGLSGREFLQAMPPKQLKTRHSGRRIEAPRNPHGAV